MTSPLTKTQVVGRYAPSPTGELHLGNLRTAVVAWLHARLQGGRFLLRMEDLDAPRCVPGSDQQIIRDLEWLGLDWDGEIVYQSQRSDLYADTLLSLAEQNHVYPCFCSRKEIRAAASAPHGVEVRYPETCRHLTPVQRDQAGLLKQPALRLKTTGAVRAQDGDFIIKRADGVFAYHLAVVVDDLSQGITEVVRGADLLSSVRRQQYLAKLLTPELRDIDYYHVALMLDEEGQRLSKRDGSMGRRAWQADTRAGPERLLSELLTSLGLTVPSSVKARELLELLSLSDIRAVCIRSQQNSGSAKESV